MWITRDGWKRTDRTEQSQSTMFIFFFSDPVAETQDLEIPIWSCRANYIQPANVLKYWDKVSEIILILEREKGEFMIWIIQIQITSFHLKSLLSLFDGVASVSSAWPDYLSTAVIVCCRFNCVTLSNYYQIQITSRVPHAQKYTQTSQTHTVR